jgi:hypothetical protein
MGFARMPRKTLSGGGNVSGRANFGFLKLKNGKLPFFKLGGGGIVSI